MEAKDYEPVAPKEISWLSKPQKGIQSDACFSARAGSAGTGEGWPGKVLEPQVSTMDSSDHPSKRSETQSREEGLPAAPNHPLV